MFKRILLLGCFLCSPLFAEQNRNPELQLSRQLFEQARYEEAVMELLQIKKKRSSDELLYILAKCMQRLANPTLEAFYWQELLSKFPGSAYLPESKKRLKAIVEVYQGDDLLQISSDVEPALARGIEAGQEKKHDEAIIFLLQSLRKKPDAASIHFWLGWNYQYLYQARPAHAEYRELAMQHYRKSTSLIPSARALNNLACLMAGENDAIMAQYYFQKALREATSPGVRKTVQANLSGFSNKMEALRYRILEDEVL